MTAYERALALGDDALVTAQRLAEWCSRAPEMEEDIALANIALDQLGAARLFLTYAGELEGRGRDEDDLAYLRETGEFRNALLAELDNGDFAVTMAKLLFMATFQRIEYDRMISDGDPRLAGIAAKARKESAYHVDHAGMWTVRLGDGTGESHRRMQAAVDALWPYTHELFEGATASLREPWLAEVSAVLERATLRRPADGPAPTGGRRGAHTGQLGELLAEMQVLHRAHPGATW